MHRPCHQQEAAVPGMSHSFPGPAVAVQGGEQRQAAEPHQANNSSFLPPLPALLQPLTGCCLLPSPHFLGCAACWQGCFGPQLPTLPWRGGCSPSSMVGQDRCQPRAQRPPVSSPTTRNFAEPQAGSQCCHTHPHPCTQLINCLNYFNYNRLMNIHLISICIPISFHSWQLTWRQWAAPAEYPACQKPRSRDLLERFS